MDYRGTTEECEETVTVGQWIYYQVDGAYGEWFEPGADAPCPNPLPLGDTRGPFEAWTQNFFEVVATEYAITLGAVLPEDGIKTVAVAYEAFEEGVDPPAPLGVSGTVPAALTESGGLHHVNFTLSALPERNYRAFYTVTISDDLGRQLSIVVLSTYVLY